MLRHIIMLMAPKTFAFNLNGASFNLRTSALSAGWDGSMHVTATVPSGISPPGLIVDGSFPRGAKLTVSSGGFIQGAGGYGGAGGGTNYGAGGNGDPGGTALAVSVALTVDNLGIIEGGGGGGGGGGGVLSATGGSGGGGASYSFPAQAGGNGSTGFSGAGAAGVSGGGGSGGSYGSVGDGGYTGNAGGSPGGTGGAAGAAVTGNSNITWINTGTRIGPIA